MTTASINGKRRQLTPMEQAFGRHTLDTSNWFRIDFDGTAHWGKVDKVIRRGRCELVKVTLVFDGTDPTVVDDENPELFAEEA